MALTFFNIIQFQKIGTGVMSALENVLLLIYVMMNSVQVIIHILSNYTNTHLSFRYHLKDVIVGKIYFLLVRIKIKHMEIDIIKRETTGTGPNVYHENDTIAKYEIMDGAPVRGTEQIWLYSVRMLTGSLIVSLSNVTGCQMIDG